MLFHLADDIFAHDGDELHDLLSLLRHAFDGRHRVHVEPSGARFRAWLQRRSDAERAWVTQALDASMRNLTSGSPRRARVLPTDASRWDEEVLDLSVRDAARLASAPLRLLLEDFEDDGHFLAWVGKALGNSMWSTVREAMLHGWIVVAHGGGNSSMLRLLRALKPDASPRPWGLADARGVIRPDHQLCRHWVMFDHDGTEPGDSHRGANAEKLATTCRDLRVRHHALGRRSIENYLPEPLLQRWSRGDFDAPGIQRRDELLAQRQRLCDAYSRLSKDQQRHYHLREGLRKDSVSETGVPAAFTSISDEDRGVLARGFDGCDRHGITRLFSDPSAAVSTRTLRNDGSHREAAQIIQSIVEAL